MSFPPTQMKTQAQTQSAELCKQPERANCQHTLSRNRTATFVWAYRFFNVYFGRFAFKYHVTATRQRIKDRCVAALGTCDLSEEACWLKQAGYCTFAPTAEWILPQLALSQIISLSLYIFLHVSYQDCSCFLIQTAACQTTSTLTSGAAQRGEGSVEQGNWCQRKYKSVLYLMKKMCFPKEMATSRRHVTISPHTQVPVHPAERCSSPASSNYFPSLLKQPETNP